MNWRPCNFARIPSYIMAVIHHFGSQLDFLFGSCFATASTILLALTLIFLVVTLRQVSSMLSCLQLNVAVFLIILSIYSFCTFLKHLHMFWTFNAFWNINLVYLSQKYVINAICMGLFGSYSLFFHHYTFIDIFSKTFEEVLAFFPFFFLDPVIHIHLGCYTFIRSFDKIWSPRSFSWVRNTKITNALRTWNRVFGNLLNYL